MTTSRMEKDPQWFITSLLQHNLPTLPVVRKHEIMTDIRVAIDISTGSPHSEGSCIRALMLIHR